MLISSTEQECWTNEGVSQSYEGKSVVSLLSIPTMGGGEGPTIPTMVGKIQYNVSVENGN